MTFSNERWYALCAKHKEKLEKKHTGIFEPHTDSEVCEWTSWMGKCKEEAKWEFVVR